MMIQKQYESNVIFRESGKNQMEIKDQKQARAGFPCERKKLSTIYWIK